MSTTCTVRDCSCLGAHPYVRPQALQHSTTPDLADISIAPLYAQLEYLGT